MITFNNNIFKIDTKNTSYIIRVSKFNHLLNDYYGAKIEHDENYEFSMEKYPTVGGCTISYDKNDHYCLDMYSSEVGSVGKGDYKEPSLIIDNGKDFMLDLIYQDYEINDKHKVLDTLPTPHGKLEELVISNNIVYKRSATEIIQRKQYIGGKSIEDGYYAYLLPLHECDRNLLAYANKKIPLYVLQQLYYRLNGVNINEVVLNKKNKF